MDLNAEQETNKAQQQQIADLKRLIKEIEGDNSQLKMDWQQCKDDLDKKNQEIEQLLELNGQLKEMQRQHLGSLDESVELGDQSFGPQGNNADWSGEFTFMFAYGVCCYNGKTCLVDTTLAAN